MITNEKQYKSAISAVRMLEDAIAQFDILKSIQSGVDPVIAKAQITSYELKLSDLVEQVKIFDKKRVGIDSNFPFSSISELGEHLIGCRVARGWTQRQLADVLGVKEQQVQRYERDRYATISLSRLSTVSEALGIKVSGLLEAGPNEGIVVNDFDDAIDPSLYPISEMNARGWLGEAFNLRKMSLVQKKDILSRFFAPLNVHEFAMALHKKTVGNQNPQSQAALLAWQARVIWLANQKKGDCKPFSKLDPDILKTLVQLSRKPDGPQMAIEFLLKHGVIVICEPHLPKTKLDGAAMVLDGRYAVIGLTLRHDRIDNFWFVLLHELGHVMLHWGPLLRQGFIDEEIEKSQNGLEIEANEFARNMIVPDEAWNSSFVRYSQSPQILKEFAAKWSVHEALVAGRVRFERSDYMVFGDMIGTGQVRNKLARAGLVKEFGK
jgi:HTH-type transcriptional regulator / antitoxin HigA